MADFGDGVGQGWSKSGLPWTLNTCGAAGGAPVAAKARESEREQRGSEVCVEGERGSQNLSPNQPQG